MRSLLALACILGTSILASASAGPGEWRPLFQGNLDGWRTWLSFPEKTSDVAGLPRDADGKFTEKLGWDRDPLGVFSVVELDGRTAIRASGETFGLLLSRERFGNCRLRLQWRWGEKKWPPRLSAARDSGLLYFVNGEQGRSYVAWPSSLELQIQEKDTGDLYALLTKTSVRAHFDGRDPRNNPLFRYDPTSAPVALEQAGPDGNRAVKSGDHEKPHGEWNTIELVCLGSDSVHVVNGHVVLRVHDTRTQADGQPLAEGFIGLQSEGAEVFFRDIEVMPITAMPAEFAAP